MSIPWFQPEFDHTEAENVAKVIQSGFINDGPQARAFEDAICELVGAPYAVAVTSGTVALALSLMAAGVGPGDDVLVPNFTFIASANAVKLAGANVKLVDVEPTRLSFDLESLKNSLSDRTKAVMPVDINGRGANYDFLVPWCRENNLFLISDSAEALGSKWKNQYLGTFGDAGCFSFSPNKFVTTGQGGVITTNHKDIYERLVALKDQGRSKRGTGGDDPHPTLGFNFKFTDLQASVGLAQLPKLQQRLERAQERDAWYRAELRDIKDLVFFDDHSDGEVRLWMDILSPRREQIVQNLNEKNIGNRNFWHPLHEQKPYAQENNNLLTSIEVSQAGLWLPSTFNIKKTDVVIVCDAIKKTLNTHSMPPV